MPLLSTFVHLSNTTVKQFSFKFRLRVRNQLPPAFKMAHLGQTKTKTFRKVQLNEATPSS